MNLVQSAPWAVLSFESNLLLVALHVGRLRKAFQQDAFLHLADLAAVQEAQKVPFSRFVLTELFL
jgi:hypothetical protein